MAVFRGKIIALNIFINKKNLKSVMSPFMLVRAPKPKVKRKKIITIKAKISKIEKSLARDLPI